MTIVSRASACVLPDNVAGSERARSLPSSGRDRAVLLAFLRNRPDAWCKPRYFVICVDGRCLEGFGTIKWVQIDIDAAARDVDRLIGAEERFELAMARP